MLERSELTRINHFIEDFILPGPSTTRNFITASCLSPDRKLFAYSDSDGLIIIYDLLAKKIIRRFTVKPFFKVILIKNQGIPNANSFVELF